MESDFLSTPDLFADAFFLFEHGIDDRVVESSRCNGLDNAKLPSLLTKRSLTNLRGVEMAQGLCFAIRPAAPAPTIRKWVGFGTVI
jgi:hypothetical protein